jgi:short-subunit dehydrogenase
MTADFKKGILWASPEKVAVIVVRACNKKSNIVYAPWFWFGIMTIIKLLPERIFKKSSI